MRATYCACYEMQDWSGQSLSSIVAELYGLITILPGTILLHATEEGATNSAGIIIQLISCGIFLLLKKSCKLRENLTMSTLWQFWLTRKCIFKKEEEAMDGHLSTVRSNESHLSMDGHH
jgi:hypothetical protein